MSTQCPAYGEGFPQPSRSTWAHLSCLCCPVTWVGLRRRAESSMRTLAGAGPCLKSPRHRMCPQQEPHTCPVNKEGRALAAAMAWGSGCPPGTHQFHANRPLNPSGQGVCGLKALDLSPSSVPRPLMLSEAELATLGVTLPSHYGASWGGGGVPRGTVWLEHRPCRETRPTGCVCVGGCNLGAPHLL